MRRRQFNQLIGVAIAASALPVALALDWSALSQRDALKALKTSLEQGASQAVSQLGVQGGFMGNPKVQIPLPSALNRVAPLLRTFGQGQRLDALHQAMNSAAEQAVPLAKPLLLKAVRGISVQDAKGILTGGDTSVTDYFAQATRSDLMAQFLPRVRSAMAKVGVAQQYDAMLSQAKRFGLERQLGPDLETYVTDHALTALFSTIGEQERALRQNPVGASSQLLQKVFGAIKP